MVERVDVAAVSAAQQALAEQIRQNSTAWRVSNHVIGNTKIGSQEASNYIQFSVIFIEEPVFTTGGMVMKLSTQTGSTTTDSSIEGGSVGGGGSEYGGPGEVDANIYVNRDDAFAYPIISAGVTRWVLDEKGQYVGAYYYLLVQYPMTIQVEATGVTNDPGPANRLNYGAAGAQPRAATWAADGTVALPVVSESLVQHWLKFEGLANWDFGKTVDTQTDGDLMTRTPGIGDGTGTGTYGVTQAQLDLAAAINTVNVLGQNGAADTPEYFAALRDVRNAEAAVMNAQGGE